MSSRDGGVPGCHPRLGDTAPVHRTEVAIAGQRTVHRTDTQSPWVLTSPRGVGPRHPESHR